MRSPFAVLALLLSPALFPLACATGAVGVEACRDIEEARCEAAAACGTVDDVAACKRFYRDHCLHGIAGRKSPEDADVSECVEAIDRAKTCASDKGPNTAPAKCGGGAPTTGTDLKTVCSIVERPWDTQACAFLAKPAEDEGTPDEGAGGVGGSASPEVE